MAEIPTTNDVSNAVPVVITVVAFAVAVAAAAATASTLFFTTRNISTNIRSCSSRTGYGGKSYYNNGEGNLSTQKFQILHSPLLV